MFKEIDSLQKEIDQYRPFKPTLLQQIREYYRIGFTYSSNALEGNSLTETETKIVLENGLTVSGKPLKDHLEAIGHSEAYDYMLGSARKRGVKEENVQQLHHYVFYRINEKQAGVYRKEKVFISGSKYACPAPKEVPKLMKQLLPRLAKIKKTMHPVEYAALAHKEFVFIHPFIDGNGRVARLLMNLILIQAGYCIAVIPPVLRSEYIASLEKAHVDDDDFIDLIGRMVRETQKDYLRLFLK